MTERDVDRAERRWSVDERAEQLAHARLAFDRELREASEEGARVARRVLVPALWGAALVGGTLLAVAVLRLLRRPRTERALLRVSIEPRSALHPLLPALGAAVARLALQRLRSPAKLRPPAGLEQAAAETVPAPEFVSSHFGSRNGRAKA